MSEQRWTLSVCDERGKRHRGVVIYGDVPPAEPPTPPATFQIVLLTKPVSDRRAPERTAVCVPQLARRSLVNRIPTSAIAAHEIVASLKRGKLPSTQHAQYAAGRIVLPAGHTDTAAVFRAKNAVDLEHLAQLLIEQARAEALAPFTAIIHRELIVPRGESPLQALEARLSPNDPAERPPARAPGIVRLNAALRRLNAGALPQVDIETFIDDLRFLRLFERDEHTLDRSGLERLLADVTGARPRSSPKRKPARILPIRRAEEDA